MDSGLAPRGAPRNDSKNLREIFARND